MVFCKYCGRMLGERERFCIGCGRSSAEAPVVSNPEKKPTGLIAALIVMVAVVVVMGVSGILVWNDLQHEIEEKEELIAEQEEQIGDMKTKSENYDIICSLNNVNIGYISNEFRVTKGTVVLSKEDMGKQITLTTDWLDGATISTSYEGTSATLEFDNNTWYEKTTMTIVPHHEGITLVTFTNNLNSESFKVLLIVTE